MDNLCCCNPQYQTQWPKTNSPKNPFKIIWKLFLEELRPRTYVWQVTKPMHHSSSYSWTTCVTPGALHVYQNAGVMHKLQQRLLCPLVRGRDPFWTWNKTGKTIEVTINLDWKMGAGYIGLSANFAVTERWVLDNTRRGVSRKLFLEHMAITSSQTFGCARGCNYHAVFTSLSMDIRNDNRSKWWLTPGQKQWNLSVNWTGMMTSFGCFSWVIIYEYFKKLTRSSNHLARPSNWQSTSEIDSFDRDRISGIFFDFFRHSPSCVLKKRSINFSHMNAFGTTDLTATFRLWELFKRISWNFGYSRTNMQ